MKRTWPLFAILVSASAILSVLSYKILPVTSDSDLANRTTDLTVSFLTGLLAVQLTIWGIAVAIIRSNITSIDKRDISTIMRWIIAFATWTCVALLTTILARYFVIRNFDRIAFGILTTSLASTILILHLASRKM
jgi:hypothetical protein